jgi:isoquinoline 1-oxidoreductase subunit beta
LCNPLNLLDSYNKKHTQDDAVNFKNATMKSISRRKFMQMTSVAGVFLTVGHVQGISGTGHLVAKLTTEEERIKLNQFISIGRDGSVVLLNHRPEMGQGTYQSIPMILAEELEVDIYKVEIRPAPANAALYGSQFVVGSRSIQTEFENLRKMGAAAREMLLQAAANIWKIDVGECKATNGTIVNKAGAVLNYGELVIEASKIPPPQNPTLKKRESFSIIGKPVSRRDIPLKTNGEAKFGIDISVPGMLHASVEHSPVFLATVKSFNKDEVLRLPGVRHVLQTERELYGQKRQGVAVLAESYWQALQGRKALKVEWDAKDLQDVSSETIAADSYEAAKMEGEELFNRGDLKAIFASGKNIIEAAYETPYQAHATMEPMNAIVSVTSTSAEFWGSTQNPNGIRTFLSKTYQIPEENVKINYTFMGGGFGRRGSIDVAEEAADLSKKAGVPVKVIWTREDDITQGPFRACSLNVCRAVLDDSGNVSAFEHKIIAQEIVNQSGPNMKAGRQIMGGVNTEYKIPNFTVSGVLRKRHIPITYWRAVYHSTNPFAHECFIDELAHHAGKDSLQFRLDMIDNPRYRRVLEVVAEKTNWKGQAKNGTGRGIAIAERSGAFFAMVIEVEQRNKKIVPLRVTTAIDVGICINPDTTRAQTEGSIIMGLGACYNGLTVRKGAVAEQNFNTYPILKINQCPEIVTYIIDSDAAPDGAGEAGLPTVAPALANAIYNLTGKRIRKLPVDLAKIV